MVMSFGASGLDRAAGMRRDSRALAEAAEAGAPVLVFWRGKVLVDGDGQPVWLNAGHPVLKDQTEPLVFLGLDEGTVRFAADISAWVPEENTETELFFDPTVQVHPDGPDGTGFHELRGVMANLSIRDGELLATAKALLGWHATHGFCARCGAKSDVAEAGWQRVCPTCDAHHFPRTDPVVIVLVTHGNDVLLGRSPPWPEGMYSLLAGFVEPGETLEAAAAREVFEESGIRLGPVRYLQCQPWPFPGSLMVGMAAEALNREITLDPEELEDAIWLSREEVMAATEGRHGTIKPARQGAIARSLIELWLEDRAG